MASQVFRQFGAMTASVMKKLIAPMVGREDLGDAIGYISGAGSPATTSAVGDFIGQLYFDTTNNVFWRCTLGVNAGGTSSNWVQLGGSGQSVAAITAALLNLTGNLTATAIEDTLTAHSGGTQAAALPLSPTKLIHRVTTVGAAGDSVALPEATGSGNFHLVKNSAAANSMQVFAGVAGTSKINDVTSATGVAQAAGKGVIYHDHSSGNYYTYSS